MHSLTPRTAPRRLRAGLLAALLTVVALASTASARTNLHAIDIASFSPVPVVDACATRVAPTIGGNVDYKLPCEPDAPTGPFQKNVHAWAG